MLALLAALLFAVAAITNEASYELFTVAPATWAAVGLLLLAVQIALADAYVARRVNRQQRP